MPFVGVGVHVIIALFFAIHAVRTGRNMYWLMILFFFPLLGSIVYFFAIYLPDTRLQYGVRKAATVAIKSLDPGKEIRAARQAFEMTPTAQNQMRLAAALLEAGDAAQAAQHYEACLQGPFANEPEILFGAANARFQNGQGAAAVELLEKIRSSQPRHLKEPVLLLLAQAYALVGREQEARTEFAAAVAQFGSFEAHALYALWAQSVGDNGTAMEHYREVERLTKHWNSRTRSLNKALLKQLDAAFAGRQ